MEVAERIAQFVTQTRLGGVPGEAIDLDKRHIRDTHCVTIAAVREPARLAMLDLLRDLGGNPRCSVVGTGLKTAPALAALANGTMGHALDYDDGSNSIRGHVSVPLLPAVLALGEQVGASGRDVTLAFLLGYELEAKLGLVVPRQHYTIGWRPTAVFGTMGAAAASARLLGLSSNQTTMALGIAASQAWGLWQNFGSDTKPFHAGNAARSGVLAAMLAQKGFTASTRSIEGPQGFPSYLGRASAAR